MNSGLMLGNLGGDASRLGLWVVTRDLGVPSQVWMLRQVRGFLQLRPTVVTWADHRGSKERAEGAFATHVLPFPPDLDQGPGRWAQRLARLPGGNFYGTRGAERRHLARLLDQDRPVAILAHFGHAALRVLPVARATGIPVVAHFHGLDLSSSLRNPWYRRSLLRHLGDLAACVVVGTRQRDWLQARHPRPDTVHLIPCGAPLAEFVPAGAPPQGPPATFAVVSRLVPQKGVEVCLRALALLPPGSARLEVVGEGPERARLQALAGELGVAEAVAFAGARPPAEVRATLGRSVALLQHSLDAPDGWYEGFGVTVAESSAMAVPTVASRCGGLMDQVVDGETGLLVEQRDHRGLAAAMARLLADPTLRDRLGQAARERTARLFDTAAQVRRLEDLLLEVGVQAP